jgi:protein-disulfide isomerase
MKNKTWPLVILGLVLVAVIILIIISRFSVQKKLDAGTESETAKGTSSEIQAQTYLASSSPVVEAGDEIFGSSDAVLKIFVYEDYTSLYSANLADTLDKIKAEFGNRVVVIIRPYIVDDSVASLRLAQAVSCAGEQGKWKEMRALLFAQAKNKQLLVDNLPNYETQLSLNNNDFAACLTNIEKSGRIEQSVAAAQSYGVQGTPTMFIGGEMVIGARPYEDFVDSNGDKIIGLKSVVEGRINL